MARNGVVRRVNNHRMQVTLRFASTVLMVPHPKKVSTNGEDAIMLTSKAIGVFDGVGSWKGEGVDAGKYSRRLARLTSRQLESSRITSFEALRKAALQNKLPGSSTACVANISGSNLCGVNVGDSGLIVFRDGQAVFETNMGTHGYNFPHQLKSGHLKDLFQSTPIDVSLQYGDVIITASDGLFDNVSISDIKGIVKTHVLSWNADRNDIRQTFHGRLLEHECIEGSDSIKSTTREVRLLSLVNDLVNNACKIAHDREADSPFSRKSQTANKAYRGGKLDDITVMASMVVGSSQRRCTKAIGIYDGPESQRR